MQTDVAEKIARRVNQLPTDKQEKVLQYVESLVAPGGSFLDVVREIEETIPDEVLQSLPTDGAENHDHYLYGARKK